jgi:hypothetical protein
MKWALPTLRRVAGGRSGKRSRSGTRRSLPRPSGSAAPDPRARRKGEVPPRNC